MRNHSGSEPTHSARGGELMNIFSEVTDPTDLDSLRRVIAAAPDAERLVALDIATLVISDDATARLVTSVSDLIAKERASNEVARVCILVDSTKILRAGRDLKADIAAMLSTRFTVSTIILGADHHLHADDVAIDIATEAVREADCIVTIGGGTITDIGKVASHRIGDVPLVVVQTAASVDGFTDNVSVLLRNGVKRTEPSRWPDVVLADTITIAGAPVAMNKAGFGEVLSLYTAPADWELAHLFGLDSSFNRTPRDLLLEFAGDPAEWASGIHDRDQEAVGHLTRVLAIRGIGTGIAGSTACLSGVEHLISHMLDMFANSHGEEMGFHGAQVGVGSVVAAAAWQYFTERLADGVVDDVTFPDAEELESDVKKAFEWCDPTGEKGEECWSDYRQKLDVWNANQSLILEVLRNWDSRGAGIALTVPGPEVLALSLLAAGAPAEPASLGAWVQGDVWHWAVKNCHFMRNRLTIVDLLFFFGWWTDQDVLAVLTRARSAMVGAPDAR